MSFEHALNTIYLNCRRVLFLFWMAISSCLMGTFQRCCLNRKMMWSFLGLVERAAWKTTNRLHWLTIYSDWRLIIGFTTLAWFTMWSIMNNWHGFWQQRLHGLRDCVIWRLSLWLMYGIMCTRLYWAQCSCNRRFCHMKALFETFWSSFPLQFLSARINFQGTVMAIFTVSRRNEEFALL